MAIVPISTGRMREYAKIFRGSTQVKEFRSAYAGSCSDSSGARNPVDFTISTDVAILLIGQRLTLIERVRPVRYQRHVWREPRTVDKPRFSARLHFSPEPVAQLVEQQTFNLRVEGSIPSRLIWSSRPSTLLRFHEGPVKQHVVQDLQSTGEEERCADPTGGSHQHACDHR